jgi:GWxTD domain-containing protein
LFGIVAGAAAVWSGVVAQVEPAERLDLRAARFYRAAQGRTMFDVFGKVSLGMVEPLPSPKGDGAAAYRVSISVKDSAGLELLSRSWTQVVAELPAGAARASMVEYLNFAADPGHYVIEFVVRDSASGRISRQALDVRAFERNPVASDLLLGTGVRPVGSDSAGRPGEVRKGAVFVEASGRPVLTPQQAQLGYYVELYGQRAETAMVSVATRSLDRTFQTRLGEERLVLGPSGGAMRGQMDLTGLPPGEYQLELTLRLADTTVTRTAEFGMAGFETDAAIAPTGDDVFASMTEAQLDTLYLPLVYLMTREEQGLYDPLSLRGKREYMRQFWARRDPTPGTTRNEAQEGFYTRIAEANSRYSETGSAAMPGWRTDRGRIFIKHGAPDEILQQPQASSSNPYEVWKYTRNRQLKYVFMDLTKFGNYALIFTTDRREPSRANWQALLGREGVQEVQRF